MDYYEKSLSALKGMIVVDIVKDDSDFEPYYGLVFENITRDRYVMWFLSDDEGNGAGSWQIEKVEKKEK